MTFLRIFVDFLVFLANLVHKEGDKIFLFSRKEFQGLSMIYFCEMFEACVACMILKHPHSVYPPKKQIWARNGTGVQITAQKTLPQADIQWQTSGFIKYKVLDTFSWQNNFATSFVQI